MRSLAALIVVVAACSKGQPDDCVIVRDKPGSAMAELSSRYPNNPVKVAETIEKCVAPSGDDCERIAKIVAAMPALAPQLAAPAFEVAKTCRVAPPPFRRCLLPSYQLAHQDECKQVMQSAITELEIKPSTERAPPADDCGFVSIYIDGDGTWLATGRDDKSWCFAARKAGALDSDWLEVRLSKLRGHACRPSSAELAGAADVAYQDLIATLDIAVKTGFMDTGLSAPTELAVPLASASIKDPPRECPLTLIARDATATPPANANKPAAGDPPRDGRDALANAPVVIISKHTLTLKVGDVSTDIATVTAAASATKLDALTKALPKTRAGLLILQADQTTPTRVINLVVTTVKAAGYDNVLFAVKSK